MRIAKGTFVGLAIFTVSTVSYSCICLITGRYFSVVPPRRYLFTALLGAVLFGIWAVRKNAISARILHLLTSAFIGFALVSLAFFRALLSLHGEQPHIGPASGALIRFAYWPLDYLVFGRLDCPEADSIHDKLTCAGLSVGISCLGYSAVAYLLLWLIKRWRASRIQRPVSN